MSDLESKSVYEGPGACLWKVSVSFRIYEGIIALVYECCPKIPAGSDATLPAKFTCVIVDSLRENMSH